MIKKIAVAVIKKKKKKQSFPHLKKKKKKESKKEKPKTLQGRGFVNTEIHSTCSVEMPINFVNLWLPAFFMLPCGKCCFWGMSKTSLNNFCNPSNNV